MKNGNPVVLLLDDNRCRIGIETTPGAYEWSEASVTESGSDDTARQTAKALKSLHYSGHPLVLGIPSSWCLASTVTTDELPRQKKLRHQTLIYRLEEQLPLAAEDFVAAFPASARPDAEILAVAAPIEKLSTWVHAFENAGVAIGPICPATFLTLQSHNADHPKSDSWDLWLIDDKVESVNLREGFPVRWNILEASSEVIKRHRMLLFMQRLPCESSTCVNFSDQLQKELAQEGTPKFINAGVDDCAADAAARILNGKLAPWINLRQDALAASDRFRMIRRPLNMLIAASIFLTISTIGSLVWTSYRYTNYAGEIENQQAAIFQKLYPNAALPLGVRARLQSESTRLRALNGQSDLPRPNSALATLYEVLRRLPSETKYRILDMRVGPEDFAIQGQCTSHGDADVIASGLRRQKGFTVEPTRTELLPGGQIGFALVGKISTNVQERK
jgi:type II secretion system protein L